MKFVRPVREGQIRVFERIHGAQERPAEPRPFSDVFNGLDPKQMGAAALTEFAKTLLAGLPGGPADQVAIVGKVLKGTILDASKQSALHLVREFEPGAGLVLG